ncbi:helix-turn-helix domain-containing protein [Thermaerobacter sp. PB12/4term]|uniref:helix-turn-helix domain-containing protein n=1 Tax=Thermaerobacter sp. PB12/4term TaxID=2293838 RepID=UPI000E3277D5|nr:helix-turn-helix domain-containing protein [Thermaerobacter sp. PB12/4term]QIA26632.1 helix-turn-helix domain-containing protein [Thermaerobacter sp. PB12/4term]
MSEYLTSSQAARLLGVSRSTFLNWQSSGKLAEYGVHPIQTLGGQYRYKRDEIEELLRMLTAGGHPDGAPRGNGRPAQPVPDEPDPDEPDPDEGDATGTL